MIDACVLLLLLCTACIFVRVKNLMLLTVFLPVVAFIVSHETDSLSPFLSLRTVYDLLVRYYSIKTRASFSSVNWREKHCIRISVAFRLYLVKIIQILTN
jgi:hypothetical protein